MAKTKLEKIEKKYSKKIAELLELYKDKTMQELWVALDLLKNKMKAEMDEAGIK